MERKVASTVRAPILLRHANIRLTLFIQSRHMMGPNLHLDILMGRDERLDYADVFGGEHPFCYGKRNL